MKKILLFIFILCAIFSFVYAHVSIHTAPITACGSIDSTDLATHVANQIDNRIATAGATSTSLYLFTTRGDSTTSTGSTTSSWVRNTSVWTNEGADLDFTGVSAWTQQYNGYSNRYQHIATLITPRHFVTAHHWGIANNSTLAFITNTNQIIYRTVVNTTQVGTSDIAVGILDSDVPDTVTYYPIIASSTLSAMLNKYIPTQNFDLPIVIFNQSGQVYTSQLYAVSNSFLSFSSYSSGTRSDFSMTPVSGDSGNPLFVVIDNEPVFLSTLYSSGTAPNYGASIADINSAIVALGANTGYHVSEYTPTCFTEYTPNNIPTFTSSTATSTLAHESPSAVIHTFTTTDADAGDTLSYSLVSLSSVSSTTLSLTPSDYFSVNSSTGELTQTADLDNYTMGNKLLLVVKATDDGTPVASANSTITITIDYPQITSASVKNTTLELGFDNELDNTSVPSGSDFVVNVNSSPVSVSSVSISDSKIILTLGSTVSSGDTVTVAYTPGTNKIKDTNGAYASAITSPINVPNSHAGDVDTSFDPGTGFSSVSAGTLTMNKVLVSSSGKIYVGGNFDRYNGSTVSTLVRLNTDGSLDTSFSTGAGFTDSTGSSGFTVNSIYEHADGKLMVGGNFDTYDGVSASKIIRLNSDGSRDSSFDMGTGFSSVVSAPAQQPDGKYVFAGSFDSYNGTSALHIIRLNSDGSIDSSFNSGTGFNGDARAVSLQSDGKILVAGLFTQYNGTSRSYFARLNTDGSLDTSFVPDANIASTYLSTSGGTVLRELSNGKILAAGFRKTTFTASHPIMLLNSDGSFDSFLDSTGLGLVITSVAIQSDGKYVASGSTFFHNGSSYQGTTRYNYIGGIDETYTRSSTGATTNSIALDANEDIFAIGTFTSYGGISRNRIVKLYGSTAADVTSPTITNVTSSASNGSKAVGVTVPIQITFSESVNVTGSPVLHLDAGNATYASGSGSSALTFNYTVGAGDVSDDLSYSSVDALDVNGGTIADTSGNDADLTLPSNGLAGSLGYNKDIVIDGVAPTIFAPSVDDVTLTLLYDEDLDTGSVPEAGDFVISKNSTIQTGSILNIAVSGRSVILTLLRPVFASDVISISYTPGTYPIRDFAGNDASSVTLSSITNGSPEALVATSNNSGGSGGGGGSSSGLRNSQTQTLLDRGLPPLQTSQDKLASSIVDGLKNAPNLSLGSVSMTVKLLQQFLNQKGFIVSTTGAGSLGNESNYFGQKTKQALAKFQASAGITPAVGFFGPKTRAFINTLSSSTNSLSVADEVDLCTVNTNLISPIKFGGKNNTADVKFLETFLNTYEKTSLPINGVYDVSDFNAIVKFQEKYASDILSPYGAKLTKGTGYVYTTTLKKIKSIIDSGCKK